MRLLLDTNALVWWMTDEKLSSAARRAIGNPRVEVTVSAVSVLEVALKISLGKMTPPESVGAAVEAQGFRRLPVTFQHAEAVAALPSHHRDPFDRLLIAQAQLERLTIVTRDAAFDAYEVEVLRC